MASLDFWFEFGSTYSYPAALRVEDRAAAAGVALRWRPFLLGPIFRDQGWEDSPFNLQPAKGRYMWRDLERQCAKYGLPFQRPSVFPRSGLLPARVALAAADAPWVPAFVRGIYAANFAEDREIADAQVVGSVLEAVGADPVAWLARAAEPDVKQALREQTDAARHLGIFGAPTCAVGSELFWGDDRLEDALAWAVDSA